MCAIAFFDVCLGRAAQRAFDVSNRLQMCQADNGEHAPQILLEFAKPIFIRREETIKGEQVCFYFPGLTLDSFKKHNVAERIRGLQFIKDVNVSFEELPVPQVVLTITVAKNKVIIGLLPMDDYNRFIIDFHSKDVLKTLQGKSDTWLSAKNETNLELLKKKDF